MSCVYFEIFYFVPGASPRRADARLSSAHARNYRGCVIFCKKLENFSCEYDRVNLANRGRNCDSAAKGYIQNISCLDQEEENNGTRSLSSGAP